MICGVESLFVCLTDSKIDCSSRNICHVLHRAGRHRDVASAHRLHQYNLVDNYTNSEKN